jgi:membrane protease subunit HflK
MNFGDLFIILIGLIFLGFNYAKRNPNSEVVTKFKNFLKENLGDLKNTKDSFKSKIRPVSTSNDNSYFESSNHSSNSNSSSSSSGKSCMNLDHKALNILFLLIGVVFCFYLGSGFYIIQPEQQGIETRFGRYSVTTDSGLHYHLPSPFEKVYKLNVTSVNTEEIGYRLGSSDTEDSRVLNESTMITKDENIVDVSFDVQWKISEANSFIFNIKNRDVRETIRNVAESVMREIIGQNSMFFILGEGRAVVAEKAMKMMQQILNEYKIGVQVLAIPIKKIDPPKEVISAFRDVQSARADKEKDINLGQSYRNDIVPRAKGQAAQIINEAESYSYETINRANGDVARMISIYPMYKANPDLVKIRLYTDLMREVLEDKKIIVTDSAKSSSQLNLINPADLFKNSLANQSMKKNEE